MACSRPTSPGNAADDELRYQKLREEMVARHIEGRVRDPAVLRAMRTVRRHRFVPPQVRDAAYENHPLPIGLGQTISQPIVVAEMTELARIEPGERVLEIGTGSGYQAAVLASLGAEVYTIEIIEELGRRAREALREEGFENIHFRIGDGFEGWPEAAPFDAIVVTAAPEEVPPPLLEQLAVGGRLVIPVGGSDQELRVYTRGEDGSISEERVFPVRFVPMTGRAQRDS